MPTGAIAGNRLMNVLRGEESTPHFIAQINLNLKHLLAGAMQASSSPTQDGVSAAIPSSDPTKEARKIHVHIVDVVEQKGEGYTVILQAFPDSEITSYDVWSVALPGDFLGATRVDRLWHLYYEKDPGYSPGDWLALDLPEEVE